MVMVVTRKAIGHIRVPKDLKTTEKNSGQPKENFDCPPKNVQLVAVVVIIV
jgi:hypothetical protein